MDEMPVSERSTGYRSTGETGSQSEPDFSGSDSWRVSMREGTRDVDLGFSMALFSILSTLKLRVSELEADVTVSFRRTGEAGSTGSSEFLAGLAAPVTQRRTEAPSA